MSRRRGDYAPYPLNMLISWLIVVLALLHKVNTQADCDASERPVLKCYFPRNVNATQTDFSVYFQFDNGYEELLVDCIWLNHWFQCLKQEGFNITQQVSTTAEISLPTRFKSANGTYRCNLEGLEHKLGNPCRSGEKRQDKQVETQTNQFNGTIPENHPNDKGSPVPVHIVVLPLFAGLTVIAVAVTVLYKRKQLSKPEVKIPWEHVNA
ncbi:hypothetical protein C0Q70_12458 [Pomacea canaliculata]|uniref:Ig-like domain-containing protein n=1 Tax=Pomacea canaliculata TaxID=400727 RepID=A0A2T7P1M3_POMCA|nr:uncharacterized protein LOC112568803 [Pomacea canaliculata]PVD27303.1 hypothetical protein C0Q70_12458 [Pomacea canaliculata]